MKFLQGMENDVYQSMSYDVDILDCVYYYRNTLALYSFSVPQPTIVFRRNYSCLIPVGSTLTLNAEISFSDSAVVDVSLSLTISWSRDGDITTSI